MRSHHPIKHLPSLKPHKNSLKTVRNLPSAHSQPPLTLHSPSCIVLPIDSLPSNAEVTLRMTPLQMTISRTHINLKKGGENYSQPVKPNSQWLQINLAQNSKIVVVLMNPPQSLPHSRIYSSIDAWKQVEGGSQAELMTVSVDLLLLQLSKTGKKHKTLQTGTRNSLSGFMRAKFSEREKLPYRRSQNVAEQREAVSSTALRNQNSLIHTTLDNQTPKEGLITVKRWGKRWDSNDQKNQTMQRETTTTSSSIVNDSNQLRFSKKIKRITNFLEHRRQDSEVSAVFATAHVRPKFYQQVSISQQEFNIKRKKFDSQCVIKVEESSLKNLPSIDPKQPSPTVQGEEEPSESSVVQEIAQMENSNKVGHLEDTLQRGFQAPEPFKPQQQSGSLYESVFE